MAAYYSKVRELMQRAINGDTGGLLLSELYAVFQQVKPSQAAQKKLNHVWQSQIERENILKTNKGVSRFTLASIQPKLRDELDRRIMASIDLIKLNREASMERTRQRFSGWLSSLSAVPEVRQNQLDGLSDVARDIAKPMQQLPFIERRVIIDQSHKLVANLNQIVAYDAGAIGAIWHSHWREANYDYREDHKQLDKNFYLIKNSPAIEQGLVKKGGHGYLEDLDEQAGTAIYCRCYMEYVYRLSRVPEECLTEKGRERLGVKSIEYN